MPSLIPGYEYDIFISYRQKDNKGDGWVSEFVEALKAELESTFKEEISVYFDINPHDGLLETHEVNESLKEKLKCLVFIPIISRTYCDPKSFAWDHEFKAFVEQASKDQFGLKVKLPNGNVASRVLPVRIYDLDNEDIKLCESVLGGVMRGVEFIYEEPGVNRPLKTDDDEKINIKRTKYRNQINKVANSIKEIIQGMKSLPADLLNEKNGKEVPFEQEAEGKVITQAKSSKFSKYKWIYGAAIIALLIAAAIFVYPKIFEPDRLAFFRSKGTISVAVMPFQNMTGDESKNFWQEMIQDNLITLLSNSKELKVRQSESIITLLQNSNITNYASITPSVARNISEKLDAGIFIQGSINEIGTIIRLNARLIDSETEEIYKSFQLEGTADNILYMTDSLSMMVEDYLIVSLLKKEVSPDFQRYLGSTRSPEALRYFIDGQNSFFNSDFPPALEMFHKAIEIDSNFITPMIFLALSYGNLEMYKDAKLWSLEAYNKMDNAPRTDNFFAESVYYLYHGSLSEIIKSLRKMLELDDQHAAVYFQLGDTYCEFHQYDKAIDAFEKSLELYNNWGTKPIWIHSYEELGLAYHKQGMYRKEKEIYKKTENDFPDDPMLAYRQTVWALTKGKEGTANEYLEKYKSLSKGNSVPETEIITNLANIYWEAGLLDQAEEYFREALSLEPKTPKLINNLAWFLIDTDQNVDEGLELVDKIIELNPDNYNFLDCKGWGLYKQGKCQEALEILQLSWDLRLENAIYDYAAFLRLQEAKKAAGGQI